ncbi:MAG: hypothetical protein ACI901_001076, partial [Octadecabacter sp.]
RHCYGINVHSLNSSKNKSEVNKSVLKSDNKD